MDEKQSIEIKPTDGDALLITESREYAVTQMELRQRINVIANQKDGLIAESNRLKKRYDELDAQEKELRRALKEHYDQSGFSVIGGQS